MGPWKKFESTVVRLKRSYEDTGSMVCLTTKGIQLERNFEELKPASHVPILGTNVNNMAFYISGPKLLFETTEISTHPNSTQQESNYIYLYTTKFGTSIKIRLNRKLESTEFETMRKNM